MPVTPGVGRRGDSQGKASAVGPDDPGDERLAAFDDGRPATMIQVGPRVKANELRNVRTRQGVLEARQVVHVCPFPPTRSYSAIIAAAEMVE